MFEDLNNRRSRWRVFWPEVDDLPGAEEAIRLCYWFAFVSAGLTAAGGLLLLLAGAGGEGLSGVAGAIILALTGFGVRRRWRSAAVIGFLFLVVGLVQFAMRGRMPGVIDSLTFIAFISGVRGTFAFARFTRLAAKSGPVPMSSSSQSRLAG